MKTENEIYNTPVDNKFIDETIERIKKNPGPLENLRLVSQVAELYKDKQMSAIIEVITVSLAFLNSEAIEMVESVVQHAKEATLLNEKMKRVEQLAKKDEFTKEDIKEVLTAIEQLSKML
jgi:uncharacterized protein YwgA